MTNIVPIAGHGTGGRLGRYVLKHEVATGGMATVYLAQLEGARGFDRWFAIKVIHRHLSRDRKFVNMFLDEARVTSRLHHQNVCSIIEFGEDVAPHIVMEYLHGETLASCIRNGWKNKNLPIWLGARVVSDAARGLHAAHNLVDDEGNPLNLVHRDVSPQNIMVLYDGLSKMLDFGVARARGRITQTEAQEVKGKIAYMAPEQLHGQPIDRRSDIWGLGVVLWEATVGARLFRGETDGETTLNVIHKEIPRPSQFRGGYPKALEEAVMSALVRDPEQRVKTAAELADAIDQALYALGRPTGPAQVASWMSETFAERRRQREQLLRTDSTTLPVDFERDPPSQESLGPAPIETSGTRLTPVAQSSGTLGTLEKMAVQPKRKRRWWVALALLLTGGAAAYMALSSEDDVEGPTPVVNGPDDLSNGPSTTPEPATGPAVGTQDDDTAHSNDTQGTPSTAATADDNAQGSESTGDDTETTGTEAPADTSPAKTAATRTGKSASSRPAVRRHTTSATASAPSASEPAPSGPGKINVLPPDDTVDVLIDGKSVGSGTVIGYEVPAGTHTVLMKSSDGRTVSRKVTVQPGKRTGVSVPSY